MKLRPALASIAVGSALILGGCAATDSGAPTASSTPAAIEVEEEILTVDVRIARSLLEQGGPLTDEQIVNSARENDIAATFEGDTVIYTMSKGQRDAMLIEMRESAQATADELIADTSNSVTAVEMDDSMTAIKVSVDASKYGAMEAFLALGFYMQGAMYQQFNGVSPDDLDVIVEFVDDATGEVLDTGSFKEMAANLNQ